MVDKSDSEIQDLNLEAKEIKELEFGTAPIEPSYWFLEASLYHKEDYKFEAYTGAGFKMYRKNILNVILPDITIDVYCLNCSRETVFSPVHREINWQDRYKNNIVRNGIIYTHFKCSRKHCESDLFFIFNIQNGVVTKVGQYPSIADLISPKIEKYRTVLDPELISDWQRALGLKAHGIGAGSYVYLRKIIERIVMDAFNLALKADKIDEDEFKKSRWPEKIKMLSEYLPKYLVKNRKVYGILSKGVHELTEEECIAYFDVVNTAIKIICAEKLRDLEETKEVSSGEKALENVYQLIKKKK